MLKTQSLIGLWFSLHWRMLATQSGTIFPTLVSILFQSSSFVFKKCLWRPIRPTYVNYICLALIPVLGNHDVFPGDLYPSEAESFYRAYLTWDNLPPKCVVASEPALHNISYQIRFCCQQPSTPFYFIFTGKEAGTNYYPYLPRIRSVNVDFIQWTSNLNWRYRNYTSFEKYRD